MSEEYPDWQDEKVKVVRNHEMVVSIWPADRENAPGWFDVGMAGSKEECLAWVEKHCDGNCRLSFLPRALPGSLLRSPRRGFAHPLSPRNFGGP